MVISIQTIARAPSLARSPCHIHTWTLATKTDKPLCAVCPRYSFEGDSTLNGKCHTENRKERKGGRRKGDVSGEREGGREDDSA